MIWETFLKQKQGKSYSFGALVSVFTTIPILNLIVVPVAVCVATAMWVVEFKEQALNSLVDKQPPLTFPRLSFENSMTSRR